MKKIVKIAASVIFLLLAGTGTVHAQEGATLNLRVGNIAEQGGKVMIAVGNLDNPAEMVSKMVAADGEAVECTLNGLPEGRQNIYVYLDANGNGTLDKSATGLPLEGCYVGTVNIGSGVNAADISLNYYAGNGHP